MRFLIIIALLIASPLFAQHSPYSSMTAREIKALSDDDVRMLREGAGMGLALAAELNGYPGPKHVLELSDKLELTQDQRTKVLAVFDSMKKSAMTLGAEIIDLERQLDKAFAASTIDPKTLDRLAAAIGERQGRLRAAHLAAHIETKAILTRHQIHLYEQARGYGSHEMKHH